MGYNVVGVLGRGGSAVVELVVDNSGSLVATKRVSVIGSAAQMQVARRRLQREAEILQRLAHPAIVPILDIVDDGADVILVFPAMCESLEDRVGRIGRLPANEVARIGRALLAGLGTAHRHGVVHRDIKPSNVLFDAAGEPALSDFGVAVTEEITRGLTPVDFAVGTPNWMAPEQARGEPAGPPSDVFALAATLYFAATGNVPNLGRRRGMIGGLPVELRHFLVPMLDPRPGRRPSAAAAMGGLDGTTVILAPIGRRRRMWSGSMPTLARRTAAWTLARLLGDSSDRLEKPRRRRLAVGAAVVAAVAVATLIVLVSIGTSGGSRSDYVAGTSLTEGVPVHANLVPMSAIDSFTTHVKGSALSLCWGSLDVTLTAPTDTAEQLTIWKGTRKVANAVSTGGTPATATVDKPSCFGGDSEDLQIRVTAVAATGAAAATDFTLTRNGGW